MIMDPLEIGEAVRVRKHLDICSDESSAVFLCIGPNHGDKKERVFKEEGKCGVCGFTLQRIENSTLPC